MNLNMKMFQAETWRWLTLHWKSYLLEQETFNLIPVAGISLLWFACKYTRPCVCFRFTFHTPANQKCEPFEFAIQSVKERPLCARTPSSLAWLCRTGLFIYFIYFIFQCLHQNEVENGSGNRTGVNEWSLCVNASPRVPCVSSPLKLWHHMYEMSLHATGRQMALFSGRRGTWGAEEGRRGGGRAGPPQWLLSWW